MTSLLRDLALEKEDFSPLQEAEVVITPHTNPDSRADSPTVAVDYESKYLALISKHEQLEATHHKTLGEVSILKNSITILQEDLEESKRHIERQKEQEAEFQEVEETCADLREECERHVQALNDLQACHSDLENSLSESNNRLHALQSENKNFQDILKSKENTIAKLEKELCDVDKAKLSRSQSESSSLPSTVPQSPLNLEEIRVAESDIKDNTTPVNPNELSLEEQIEDLKECARRGSSRLTYLNTRLTAKDDMIQKLQNRIEEVITERDSFKEALQMSFVNADDSADSNILSAVSRSTSDSALSSSKSTGLTNSDESVSRSESSDENDSAEKNPSPSLQVPSPMSRREDSFEGETETKSSPPSATSVQSQGQSQNKAPITPRLSPDRATKSPSSAPAGVGLGIGGTSVLGSWQNTIAVTSVTDGFKGVTSSLGSYLYAPGAGNTGGGVSTTGLSIHHQNYIANMEKKLQAMALKNKKLAELKSLIPVVEELKEKVHQAEESAKETDKWADEEFSTLSKKMDELRELRKEAVTKYQRSQIEVEDLKQQISRTANTYSNFEDKLQEKVRRIQILEKQLKSLKENTIDVAVHEELQDRIQALTGEAKHWQQKAQSLSKEMHRAMSLQMDYNKKKDEIHKLEKKIEELEVERLNFKEAMQEAMLDKMNLEVQCANASTRASETSRSQDFKPLVKSWFR